MYADIDSFFLPFFYFSSVAPQIEEGICAIHDPNATVTATRFEVPDAVPSSPYLWWNLSSLRRPANAHDHNNLVPCSTISDYDLGGEGDLFSAPEPIIGEPLLELDPVITAAICIPGTAPDDVLKQQTMDAATQLQSIQGLGSLMDDAFYEVSKDLFEKTVIDECFQAIPAAATEEEDDSTKLQKSVSTGCLNSTDWINGGGPVPPVFLDFQQLNLEEAFGMRRAFSEGDIQALGNSNACSLIERPLIGSYTVEERKERLHRYRDKKTRRNFNRKIKYACRKALADSQPRVRGRFAKGGDSEFPKAHASASASRPA